MTQKWGGTQPTQPIADLFSGNSVVDVAVDEMVNNGGAPNQLTQFNGLIPLVPFGHSDKGGLKIIGAPVAPIVPKLLFVALSDVGRVDVLEVGSGSRVTSIRVPGVRSVSGYWRQ